MAVHVAALFGEGRDRVVEGIVLNAVARHGKHVLWGHGEPEGSDGAGGMVRPVWIGVGSVRNARRRAVTAPSALRRGEVFDGQPDGVIQCRGAEFRTSRLASVSTPVPVSVTLPE